MVYSFFNQCVTLKKPTKQNLKPKNQQQTFWSLCYLTSDKG